jgi:glycolate oxidase iron-sulfur subunit
VQPSMSPNINTATARVLDACGIQTVIASQAGCCGAVKFHLNDQDGGATQMRANIDAWWPLVERGEVEAIVMNASGCGVMVKDYGHVLRDDAAYAEKARRISELTQDLSELMPALLPELKSRIQPQAIKAAGLQAYHPPCTLQHGQQLKGGVEALLAQLGFDVKTAGNEAHLCCGSAGTYSVLNPELSKQLRDRKLGHLQSLQPEGILSANIGCITHLQSGCTTSVRHWVELLDEALTIQ